MRQYALDQLAEARRAGQVGAIAGQVHAGQHHFGMAFGELGDAVDHRARGHRAAVAAAIGDRAEGTAMVAAILHLHECAGVRGEAGGEMRRRLAHGHDVLHHHRLGRQPGIGPQLLGIADHPVHLGHRRERLRVDLRRAAGHHQLGAWPLAARAADRLAGLLDGFVGHRATVDHDRVTIGQQSTDRLALREVEPATQTDDVRG
jgi:hypothetical protein